MQLRRERKATARLLESSLTCKSPVKKRRANKRQQQKGKSRAAASDFDKAQPTLKKLSSAQAPDLLQSQRFHPARALFGPNPANDAALQTAPTLATVFTYPAEIPSPASAHAERSAEGVCSSYKSSQDDTDSAVATVMGDIIASEVDYNMEIPIVGQGRKRTASYAGLHAGPQTFFKYQKTNEDQSANIAIIVEETAHQAAAQAAAALLEPQAHKLPAVSEIDFLEDNSPEKLGNGGQGCVYLRRWKALYWDCPNQEAFVAIKQPREDGNITDLRDSYEDLAYEANAATAVPSHINLLRPVALLFRDAAHTQLAGIVYPRMEGKDLHSMISTHLEHGVRISDLERRDILQGMADGLCTMHASGHAHLDVKPANVLIAIERNADPAKDDDEMGPTDIKLADFGLSMPIPKGEQIISARCGTTGYRPYEQVRAGVQSQKMDIFAAGMVAAEMACPWFQGHLAEAVKQSGDELKFYGSSDPEKAANGELPEGLEKLLMEHVVPACGYDPEWVDVIRACWHPVWTKRPSATELFNWLAFDYGRPAPIPV